MGFLYIDFWVLHLIIQFVEIKYSKDLTKDSVKKQINIQQLWYKANQATHIIKTENKIGLSPVKLSNLKLLIRQVKNTTEIKQEYIDIVKKHILGNQNRFNK